MERAEFFYQLEDAGLITRKDAGRAYEILQKEAPWDSPGRVLLREKMVTDKQFYDYVRDYIGMNPSADYSEPGYGVRGVTLGVGGFMGPELVGEFHGFFPLAHDTMAIIMCDVSGEGLESGILAMLLFHDIIASRRRGKTVPSALARSLNRASFRYLARDQYACFSIMLLDTRTHGVDYCIAGTPPILMYRAREKHIEELSLAGPPIGIFPDSVYRNSHTRLWRGDTILAASDGAYLARDRGGSYLGMTGMKASFREHGHKDVDGVLRSVRRDIKIHTFMRGLSDDVSLVVIKKLEKRN